MKIQIEPLTLRLRQPFVIAHGTSTTRENVLVRVAGGVGEAAAVSYLGETRAGIIAYLEALQLPGDADPLALAHLIDRLPPGSAAARAALDMALHDAFGQRLGLPLYRLLGLDPQRIPPSSFTIPIGPPAQMAEQARAARFEVLKIKLGGPGGASGDLERLDAIAGATRAALRADANAGWSLDEARQLLPALAERGVQLLEQPLAAGDLEGLRELSRLPRRPPLYADEGIRCTADLVAHAGLVEGVVIKLSKLGGLRAALRDIAVARSLGLDVLLSCMIESSVAVTAAAHIAPLCQHVDLDGPLLVENDPYQGASFEGGRIQLPALPGLGLRLREA